MFSNTRHFSLACAIPVPGSKQFSKVSAVCNCFVVSSSLYWPLVENAFIYSGNPYVFQFLEFFKFIFGRSAIMPSLLHNQYHVPRYMFALKRFNTVGRVIGNRAGGAQG